MSIELKRGRPPDTAGVSTLILCSRVLPRVEPATIGQWRNQANVQIGLKPLTWVKRINKKKKATRYKETGKEA